MINKYLNFGPLHISLKILCAQEPEWLAEQLKDGGPVDYISFPPTYEIFHLHIGILTKTKGFKFRICSVHHLTEKFPKFRISFKRRDRETSTPVAE